MIFVMCVGGAYHAFSIIITNIICQIGKFDMFREGGVTYLMAEKVSEEDES